MVLLRLHRPQEVAQLESEFLATAARAAAKPEPAEPPPLRIDPKFIAGNDQLQAFVKSDLFGQLASAIAEQYKAEQQAHAQAAHSAVPRQLSLRTFCLSYSGTWPWFSYPNFGVARSW